MLFVGGGVGGQRERAGDRTDKMGVCAEVRVSIRIIIHITTLVG